MMNEARIEQAAKQIAEDYARGFDEGMAAIQAMDEQPMLVSLVAQEASRIPVGADDKGFVDALRIALGLPL